MFGNCWKIVKEKKNAVKISDRPVTTRFFYKQHFHRQHQAEICENETKAKQHSQAE